LPAHSFHLWSAIGVGSYGIDAPEIVVIAKLPAQTKLDATGLPQPEYACQAREPNKSMRNPESNRLEYPDRRAYCDDAREE